MKFRNLQDFQNLEGGIEIELLEKYIRDYLLFVESDKVEFEIAIEVLNDLLYLKVHDFSVLSEEIAEKILKGINKNYTKEKIDYLLSEFEDEENEDLYIKYDILLDCLVMISKSVDVVSFLNEKIAISKNECEKNELKECLETVEFLQNKPESTLNDTILDQILERADSYFFKKNEKIDDKNLFCGMRETIEEHEYCYTIGWRLKSEKYNSRKKLTLFAGGGKLMISKFSEDIEMAGSLPDFDFVRDFELKIRGLKEYWELEIEYEKKKINAIKTILKKTSLEILKMVDENSKIIIGNEESCELNQMKKDLLEADVSCDLILKPLSKKY
ncbi:hypothetical protein [Aureivirga sp. CE67]|uniref:hypothetical protein n=1 Tax=Aureivirga sp. CE67 TaxID=1788983 RepID=UPI0018C9DB03|nr:hypothetical protein [Aureivirga sp. CE67]